MENLKMPKYSSYRDSGVDWLGVIPSSWETKRIKFLFQIGRGRVIAQTELDNDGIYPVYSSQTQNNGILGYINTYDFDCTQITWTTDGANAGKIFLRTGKHNCTNVCGTLKPINNNYSIDFIKYSLEIAAQFYKRPDTNGAKIMNGEMAAIFVTFPPLHQQTAIAAFLDRKTALIDQAIEIKQKQIELLKERRQILIHKAVTRGLNPNVKMKDSGVEWIGEIPEHWEVKRLKHVLNINNGADYKHIQTDEGFPVIGSGGQFAYASQYMFDGEVVFLGRKGTIDKPLYFNGKFWAVDTMFYALPKNRNSAKFLYFVATTIPFSFYSTATALPSMTQSDLNNHKVSLPSIKEQNQIVEYIEGITKKLDTSISLKGQEIEKLKEYKATLINSAVTGKIKVYNDAK